MDGNPATLVLGVASTILLLALVGLAAWAMARVRAAREEGARSREPELAALRSQQAQDDARQAELRADLAGRSPPTSTLCGHSTKPCAPMRRTCRPRWPNRARRPKRHSRSRWSASARWTRSASA